MKVPPAIGRARDAGKPTRSLSERRNETLGRAFLKANRCPGYGMTGRETRVDDR